MQRKVPLSVFLSKEDLEQLAKAGVALEDLKDIQNLLGDKDKVAALLGELEGETGEQLDSSEGRKTRALSRALYAQESKWMNVSGDKKQDVVRTKGVEPTSTFLGNISKLGPLKDTGAAGSHGEHAHRLQWYMVSRKVEKEFRQKYGEDFLKNEEQAGEYRKKLQAMYLAMTDVGYTKVIDVPGKTLRPPENEPERESDYYPEEKKPPATMPLPLWSAILDVRGSHVDQGAQDEMSIFGMFHDVFAAAPVKLTGALTYDEKSVRGSLLQAGQHDALSRALLNRRLKRYFEGKGDLSLQRLLKAKGFAELTEGKHEHEMPYGGREDIIEKLNEK